MEANDDLLVFESIYSWIPSVFRVSEDGLDVHIESYINGLGPREQYPVLYRVVEKLFLVALPLLERTLALEFHVENSRSGEQLLTFAYSLLTDIYSVERWNDRSAAREVATRVEWEALVAKQQLEKEAEEAELLAKEKVRKAAAESERDNMAKFFDMPDSIAASPLRGKDLKVIVKVSSRNRREVSFFLGLNFRILGRQLCPKTWADVRRNVAYRRNGEHVNS